MAFSHKLVAVMNKQIDRGVAMNALAHMCLGLGAHMGASEMQLMDYVNADGCTYPHISKMPFIILREKNSNKILSLLQKAEEEKIAYTIFTDSMTVGTWEEQKAKTLLTPTGEIVFYGIVLYGPEEKVTQLTKKLSLWRDS